MPKHSLEFRILKQIETRPVVLGLNETVNAALKLEQLGLADCLDIQAGSVEVWITAHGVDLLKAGTDLW